MSILEIAIIGVGLSMDAVAVSMSNGMVYRGMRLREYLGMPVFFGLFQGLMPLAGYYAGTLFASLITRYSGIVIFVILGLIGANMIRESFSQDAEAAQEKRLTLRVLLLQAVATSIDAFAVGVGFCAVQVDILPSVCLIATVTAVLVSVAILIGRRFGALFENHAERIGGLILIIIGIKALL